MSSDEFDEGTTSSGEETEDTDDTTTPETTEDDSDDNGPQEEQSFNLQSNNTGQGTFTVAPSTGGGGGGGGQTIANNPHDEEFDVSDQHQATPRFANDRQQQQQQQQQRGGGGSTQLSNNPHDEEFQVEDSHMPSPNKTGGAQANNRPGGQQGGGRQELQNQPHDEFEDVEDDMSSSDDDDAQVNSTPARQNAPKPGLKPAGLQPGQLENDPHDYAVDANSPSSQTTGSPSGTSQSQSPPRAGGYGQQQQTQQQPMHGMKLGAMPTGTSGGMQPPDDDDDDEDSSDDDDDDNVPSMQGNVAVPGRAGGGGSTGATEYNPDDYAAINMKVSQEVRDLFAAITAYQPTTLECPAKLRPFIPDFIPSVGDMDVFCKIPRPDGKPDNLGLVVVDEPSSNQSNPAIVKIAMSHTVKVPRPAITVDSVEDADKRPEVIEKWIQDLKSLQYKKPLPTVSYTKPMPDIEQLIQVWPQEFEEVLSSDAVQLPPPNIDLDISQYVKLLCSILDIPTHGNLVESLHVMFTTYLEFRANQHFHHA